MRIIEERRDGPSDEDLVRQVAERRHECLAALYTRYAPIVFGMAAQSLDRGAAEEIVQDVFLAVWKNAGSFRPDRGPVRPWLLQIAHYRIANELRRKSRRPAIEPDPEGLRLQKLSAPDPAPDQVAWAEYRRNVIRSALEKLPPPQRQALGLAFFEDLTHEQVAAALQVPLGTAKSRIRGGLLALRAHLAPLVAALAAVAVVGAVLARLSAERAERSRDERALTVLTSSDSQALRATAAPGAPETAHGVYRFRPGVPLAVMTFSNFPPPPVGRSYQAWVRHGAVWTPLGTARPNAAGAARLIAEGAAFARPPDAVVLTVEGTAAGREPQGPVLIRWPAPAGP